MPIIRPWMRAGLNLVMSERPMGERQSSPKVITNQASTNTSVLVMPSALAKAMVLLKM